VHRGRPRLSPAGRYDMGTTQPFEHLLCHPHPPSRFPEAVPPGLGRATPSAGVPELQSEPCPVELRIHGGVNAKATRLANVRSNLPS